MVPCLLSNFQNMNITQYTTQNGTTFSWAKIKQICERIENNEDWQRIINDEIWPDVEPNDQEAWEVYDHCELLVQEKHSAVV
jgi:hypothetical protein